MRQTRWIGFSDQDSNTVEWKSQSSKGDETSLNISHVSGMTTHLSAPSSKVPAEGTGFVRILDRVEQCDDLLWTTLLRSNLGQSSFVRHGNGYDVSGAGHRISSVQPGTPITKQSLTFSSSGSVLSSSVTVASNCRLMRVYAIGLGCLSALSK